MANGAVFLHWPMIMRQNIGFFFFCPKQSSTHRYALWMHLRSANKHPKALYLHRWLPDRDFLFLDQDFSPHFSCVSISSVSFTS